MHEHPLNFSDHKAYLSSRDGLSIRKIECNMIRNILMTPTPRSENGLAILAHLVPWNTNTSPNVDNIIHTGTVTHTMWFIVQRLSINSQYADVIKKCCQDGLSSLRYTTCVDVLYISWVDIPEYWNRTIIRTHNRQQSSLSSQQIFIHLRKFPPCQQSGNHSLH